jgi:hypothetical protein
MRSYLLTTAIFFACSSFLSDVSVRNKNISDFTVHRLSNDRVFISWHSEGESQVIYEVLRRHKKTEQLESLGVVQPKSVENDSAEYSFVDINTFSDSSYYCLKKTNADSIIFYSITKGIEGVAKDR